MGLGGVISNLLSLISSSSVVEQNPEIEAELEKLKRMLKQIKATLYDAEQREIRDSLVKLWLKDLKSVAYDAEDVLGEYHYEVLRVQVEARDASPPDSRKRKLIQVPSGMLDQIQQIRSRFDEITNYRLALQLSEGDGPRRCNNDLQIAQTSHLVDQTDIFGREGEKKKLINLLSYEGDVVSVVTIVGMGGIGKTTLAQLAYNDQRIRKRFDKFGWISVSENFNVERLTKQSFESITGDDCGLTNLSALQEKIRNEISGKMVLLVLDDVWNEDKSLWDSFRAPFMSAALAKILVTTRNDHVGQIMQTETTFNLGYLSAEQCWLLFEHYAFGGVKQNKDPKLVEIGKQIMNKCGLLPLAVKSIASLLSVEAEEESWRDILDNELWESYSVRNKIFPSLEISYARLPTHLKPCFLYCSMFPKDYIYDVRYLVKLWIYQGFIVSKGNKTAEKIGFEYAQQLCRRSLFEREGRYVSNDFACRKFRLHDIVHDLARLNSENSCYSIHDGKVPIFPNVLYHLYIADSVNLIDPIPSDKFTALRTLIVNFSVENFLSFDLSLVQKLRALEIRNYQSHIPQQAQLSFSKKNCDFLSTVGNLKHLRYLSLNDMFFEMLPECICSLYSLQNLTLKSNYNLKELPTKIENLFSLEELIIHNCNLHVLPESLCQLKALRKLCISNCRLRVLPRNISRLTNLRYLSLNDLLFETLPECICSLYSLQNLTLKSNYNLKELPTKIGNLFSLEELIIHSCNLYVLPKSLCQLKALRKLCISNCLLKALPKNISSLTNLQTLELDNSGVSELPPSFSKFVGIQSLRVKLECETIKWLRYFPDLGGALCLRNLKYISYFMDFTRANLESMHNLKDLVLSSDGDIYKGKEDSVFELIFKSGWNEVVECGSAFSMKDWFPLLNLEHGKFDWGTMNSLQLHPNLRKLKIDGYCGLTFPEWIGSLCKLKYLNITLCNNLRFLKAEFLPLELEELEIVACHKLESISGMEKMKSLVKVSIVNCGNLCSLSMGLHGISSFGLTDDVWHPAEHCKFEVHDCYMLEQWLRQHGINYEVGSGLPMGRI